MRSTTVCQDFVKSIIIREVIIFVYNEPFRGKRDKVTKWWCLVKCKLSQKCGRVKVSLGGEQKITPFCNLRTFRRRKLSLSLEL
jgi:hypothetical protein